MKVDISNPVVSALCRHSEAEDGQRGEIKDLLVWLLLLHRQTLIVHTHT